MFKLTILFLSIGFFVSSEAQSTTTAAPSGPKPEETANKIYNLIKGFKGSKNDLYEKIEDVFNMDVKVMRPINADILKNIVDSVMKRITKDDLITVEEFRKVADTMIQKWRATNRN
jgi:hypothetical protein